MSVKLGSPVTVIVAARYKLYSTCLKTFESLSVCGLLLSSHKGFIIYLPRPIFSAFKAKKLSLAWVLKEMTETSKISCGYRPYSIA